MSQILHETFYISTLSNGVSLVIFTKAIYKSLRVVLLIALHLHTKYLYQESGRTVALGVNPRAFSLYIMDF